MKRLLGLALLMLCLPSWAATIQWFSQQTHTTSLNGSDIFAVESPFQAGYKWIDFSGLKYNLYDPNPIFNSITLTNPTTGFITFSNALNNAINFTVSDTAGPSTLIFPDVLVWTNDTTKIFPNSVEPVDVSYIATGPKSHLYYNVEVDKDAGPTAFGRGLLEAQYFTGSGAADAKLTLYSVSGANNSSSVIWDAGASSRGLPTLSVSTNGVLLYSISYDGVPDMRGYVDRSLTPGSLVTVDNTFRLISTNSAFIYNFYASNFYTTNLYSSYFYSTYNYLTNIYSSNAFITNLYVTYLTNQYAYITNLYSSNFFTTNLFAYFSTNEYAYITNLYVSNAFVTNLYASFFTNNYAYITNLWTSNAYITNLTANKIYVNNIYGADGTFTNGVYFYTNLWSGPTNTLPLYLARQRYAASQSVSITGFTGKSNYVTESVLLTISNASAANITIDLPAGVTTGNGTNTYVITNATTGKLWIEYDPNGETNAVFRWMK